ncbi:MULTISPECIES: hypothetical protein [Vibrio]|uniref:hypothetical protein n=1 Tax=Vibrio TaxID=662 RepID=UPI0020756385|nr:MULTISPECIES: hypothetical protein [Vibrio]USD35633.1 hypothetical protein J8Z27_22760 [Vibrio sp. SCSIO 43186]USD72757.1 hypothetical protein J4N41_22765 [Vibrio sp. SCSIO 43139]USD98962.1 hypothetical protein CTT30_23090 [Vibrio coralliilyticus]
MNINQHLTKLFGIITNRLQQCVFNKLKQLHALLDSKVADTYVVWCPSELSAYISEGSDSYEVLLRAEQQFGVCISSCVTTIDIETIMTMVYTATDMQCKYHKVS